MRHIAPFIVLLAACESTAEPSFARTPELVESGDSRAERAHPPPEPVDLPTAEVYLAPYDLMTAVGSSDIELVIITEATFTPETLETIERSVTLERLPTHERVDVTIEHVGPTLGVTDHHFVLHPPSELEPSWYQLAFDPSDVAALLGVTMHGPPPSRFCTTSNPVVRYPSFTVGDDRIGVAIAVSEPIRDSREVSEIIHVYSDGERVNCVSDVGQALRSEAGAMAMALQCEMFHVDSEVRIEVERDIQGINGDELWVPFGDDPNSLTVNPTRDRRLVERSELFQSATPLRGREAVEAAEPTGSLR